MTVERASTDGSIVEVLDHVLDKGIVIDARVRVALLSIGSPHGPGARGWAACQDAVVTQYDATAYARCTGYGKNVIIYRASGVTMARAGPHPRRARHSGQRARGTDG